MPPVHLASWKGQRNQPTSVLEQGGHWVDSQIACTKRVQKDFDCNTKMLQI